MDKSLVYASPHVPEQVRRDVTSITGIRFTDYIGKYLGIPLMVGRASHSKFQYIIQKVQQRLTGWKSRTLSLAGRCTLISSVLSGIPAYAMQFVWHP